MKICTVCKEEKSGEHFTKDNRNKDGLGGMCLKCNRKRVNDTRKTRRGLASKIYDCQLKSSKKRNYPTPTYSRAEFLEWCLNSGDYGRIHEAWVASGYSQKSIPSIDRLDDYKGYSFDNIRAVTWKENNERYYRDVKSGVNSKICKAVKAVSVNDGTAITFVSTRSAERNGFNSACISKCCLGSQKTHKGYCWKYV